ncbi:MAG: ABC transporter permease [Candidatus Zixiibacteriota bacterium]|nr:MAG: ABC transporter permease [candidate division Zixibacteria bacterium]
MMLPSLIREAAAALWANRLRSSLTVLGMVMGVTSVIAIVSTVEGMQADIERSLNAFGPQTVWVTRFGEFLSWDEYIRRAKRKKLTRDLIPLVEQACPDCAMVGAEAYLHGRVKYGSRTAGHVDIRGETPNVMEMRAFDVILGSYFSEEDEVRRRNVAFIGYEVYERLFQGADPVGEKIRLGGEEFTVVGVAEKLDGTMVGGMDDFVAMPLSTHQKIFRQPGNPVNLVIKVASLERRQNAIDQLRVLLRAVRRVPYDEEDDFTIVTADSLLAFIDDLTRAYKVIMLSIPLLSIIVGGIVIMNIMMISVTERTREIGIRKSIGARRRNIMAQFLYESLMLSIVGGGIGVLCGIHVGRWMLTSLMDIFTTPTTLAIVMGVGISTGVGLFFGVYPAMKAARLDPIKALSYE